MRTLRLLVYLWLTWSACAAEPELRCMRIGNNLGLVLESRDGTNYQLQISTNLSSWIDLGTKILGDGLSRTQMVNAAEWRAAFFRVRLSETAAGSAPSDVEFAETVAGTTVLGYSFVDSGRYHWHGEFGNWHYTRIDDITGRLTLTYDEDGNNPAVYREEVLLTFQTATQGTFRYSEFNSGVEDSRSITTGPFDLGGG